MVNYTVTGDNNVRKLTSKYDFDVDELLDISYRIVFNQPMTCKCKSFIF